MSEQFILGLLLGFLLGDELLRASRWFVRRIKANREPYRLETDLSVKTGRATKPPSPPHHLRPSSIVVADARKRTSNGKSNQAAIAAPPFATVVHRRCRCPEEDEQECAVCGLPWPCPADIEANS